MNVQEKKNQPPAIFVTALLMAVILHFGLPTTQFIKGYWRFLGLAPACVGIWLNIWAYIIFKQKNVAVKPFEIPSAMVKEGPVRFSRNPMYLGMTAILLGAAIGLGSSGSFVAAIMFFLFMVIHFIPAEKKRRASASIS